MAPPDMWTSNRFREGGIVAWMFTKRQLEGRGGYWVLSPSGNCWFLINESHYRYTIMQHKYEGLIRYGLIPLTLLLATLYLSRGYRNALLLPEGSYDLRLRYQE